VAFKPPATIGQSQNTVTYAGDSDVLEAKGRHDPCVVPRAVPIVEAMAALSIMDSLVSQLGRVACKAGLAKVIQEEIFQLEKPKDQPAHDGVPEVTMPNGTSNVPPAV